MTMCIHAVHHRNKSDDLLCALDKLAPRQKTKTCYCTKKNDSLYCTEDCVVRTCLDYCTIVYFTEVAKFKLLLYGFRYDCEKVL